MKSLTIILLLSVATLSYAQPPDTLWTRTHGGTRNDGANAVQQTADGGYIVAGETNSFGAGEDDFYLVKTNSQGDTIWTRAYREILGGWAYSVQQTTDGGYIVAGYTPFFPGYYCDFYLVKTNSQGDTLWTRIYGGTHDDRAYSVQQTTDGGYIVAGFTYSFGAGWRDFYLVKTNNQGDTLWTRTYGGSSDDMACSIQQTTDGGYIMAGRTGSFGAGNWDFYLVKTNSQGDTLWTRTYGGTGSDEAYSVQQTNDGGYIIAGSTESFGAGSVDFYLVKTDSQGDTLWTRTYGGLYADGAYSVQRDTTDGGYIVAGWTYSFGVGGTDFYLVKTNSHGDTLWTCTYGGTNTDCAYSVQQTIDGGYIVAGWTYSFGADFSDCYLVKLSSESSVEPISLSLPSRYSLHPNYPNPFNPSTRISYDLPSPSPVTLEVFDLLGRRLGTLTDGMQPAGNYSVLFDGSALPSGLYFYRLNAGNFVQTQKMVLLK